MRVEEVSRVYSRYTITDKGRADRRALPTCQCELKLVGLLFECPHCETIYGHSKQVYGGGGGGRPKPD